MESDQDDSIELQEALARSRRAKQMSEKSRPVNEEVSDTIIKMMQKAEKIKSKKNAADMILNHTDEFCRSLGEIPTYGLSGNRAEEDAMQTNVPAAPEMNENGNKDATQETWNESVGGTWEEVGIDETKVEIESELAAPILEEEPDTSKG